MGRDKGNAENRIVAWFTAIGAFGTLVAIVVSIHLTAVQVNELRGEARIQHLVEETVRFDQPPLLTSRQRLAAARINTVTETLRPLDIDDAPPEIWDVLNACDHIGLLTRRGYLDVSDVWNDMGYWLFNIYADAQPIIEADRKDYPASMENCSWLVEQMRPIEIKRDAGKDIHPTQGNLYDFYDGEIDAQPGKLTGRNSKAK